MKSRLGGLTTLHIGIIGLACLLLTALPSVALGGPDARAPAEHGGLAAGGAKARLDPVIVIEVVDGTPSGGNVGEYSSLTLDDAGRLAVAYYDRGNADLKFAVKDGTWGVEVVDEAGSVGKYATVSIDSLGRANVSYFDATLTSLKYAGWLGQTWSAEMEVVDGTPSGGNVGQYSSLTLDDGGHLAVTYYDVGNSDLKFAVKDGIWGVEVVDEAGSVGKYATVSIDSLGRANVSYFDATLTSLKYAGWLGQTWSAEMEVVDGTPSGGNVGQYSSLTLDDGGHLAVAYYDVGNSDLKFAVKDGTWGVEVVDEAGSVGKYATVSIDSLGRANVSYFDATLTSLKYAGWLGQTWSAEMEVVDGTPSGGNVGQYSSLTLDDGGHLAVTYYDVGNSDLKFAVKDGIWGVEVVDEAGSVGKYATVSIDSLGRANVSYFDATLTSLKYAGWLGQTWSAEMEVVDGTPSGGNVGEYSSLTLDDAGRLAVVYYDRGNSDLKFAVKDGTWGPEVVDEIGDVGKYASVSIDSLGRRNASYYDATLMNLKYAGWLTPSVGVAESDNPDADDPDALPTTFAVSAPLPNPSCGSMSVAYDVPAPGYDVTATVYSAAGRVISDVDMGWTAPGRHAFTWNGTRRSGSKVASGVYFCRIRIGDWNATRRVVLVR